jgi:dihydrofolate synthase/folylpolyglutamate synthase
MTYAEAVEYLYSLQKFGARLGLDTTWQLAAMAGNPQERLRFIHVAGTNGKGSTCAMLEAIYRAAGYKVGLFTSPHLISFAERIQINRKLIPEAEVARLANDVRRDIEAIGSATLFEATTIMALRWFEENRVDIVIWETGLGGRLDSTNIVTPLASVITNIALDHEKWLGNTVAEIAREKAGIIKAGVPVIAGVENEEASRVIQEVADAIGAEVIRASPATDDFALSLNGQHQRKNAAVALAVAKRLRDALPVNDQTMEAALRGVQWAGRFDVRGKFILDGAHNPDGARALRLALEQKFPGAQFVFIVGILADKDIGAMAREIAGVASRILTVAVHSERAADAALLAEVFRAANPLASVEACISIGDALAKSQDEPRVVITGSLHFIGEAMQLLGLETGQGNERGLNDWTRKS